MIFAPCPPPLLPLTNTNNGQLVLGSKSSCEKKIKIGSMQSNVKMYDVDMIIVYIASSGR